MSNDASGPYSREERRRQAQELSSLGVPKTKIAKRLGVSRETIRQDLRQVHTDLGDVDDREADRISREGAA
ncbi:MAG: HTH domain-containing protein [Fimbriimonadaceae bacterium]|nr:HTH domain-containing protein [Fimbriimonadaceae bacterium]QYK56638.1 MAG: HTH domain-containing protein [Fimbriimonadaceae bacterium]